jgi:2-polyprenyl-3-methyl-5-hydroxy-6-metoxy-1,4-benzoquinol methylase
MKTLRKLFTPEQAAGDEIADFLQSIKKAHRKEYKRLNNSDWAKACADEAADIEQKLRSGAFINEWTKEIERLTKAGESVCETGMANGASSLYLAKRGRICTGVDFSQSMCDIFINIGKKIGVSVKAICADITKKLPIADNSFDVVFHAGVIEHFSDDEVQFIINENARITKNRVICMAPNAASLAYRIGKEWAEKNGAWQAGEENPKHSLANVFERSGLKNIHEYSIDLQFALNFLPNSPLRETLSQIYHNLPTDDNCFQGYLLVTTGDKD